MSIRSGGTDAVDRNPLGLTAEPLVLLPGMGCTAALWSQLEVEMLASHRPVLMPTLDAATLDHQVQDLLDELPPRFCLAGLSLGGIVAMALVRRAPNRVSRLCLMSTNPHAPTEAQRRGWQDLHTTLARGTSTRDLQARLLPTLLSPRLVTSRSDLAELTLTMADDLGEEAYSRQLKLQATRVDERPGLTLVTCPTLIISAAQDQLCSVAKHEEMRQLIKGSELQVIEDCAHLSPLEQPRAVFSHLLRWLSSMTRG